MVADEFAAFALSNVFCNKCSLGTPPCFLSRLLDDCKNVTRFRTSAVHNDSFKLI